ncbi:MAG: hypothetical protein ABMA64_36930 [Myxococcota bacterium]
MWLVLGWACPAPVDEVPEPPEPVTTPSNPDTGTPVEGSPSGVTGATGDTAGPGRVIDCAAIPPVGAIREIPAARGYHDLAFATDGRIIGAGTFQDLLAADAAGTVSLYATLEANSDQMAWLPDGDLAVATTQGILRVTAAGAVTVISPDVRPYGLVVGPNGLLYASDQQRMVRVDPSTGESELVLGPSALPAGFPRVAAFSIDDTRLFVGTFAGSGGRIYAFDLDADFLPTGPPTEFASNVGLGSFHDALGVDVCGNLYATDYETSALYRITPAGVVSKLWDAPAQRHPHGLEWGTLTGGWLDDALYLPLPYADNAVAEIVIGVPARGWTDGAVINLP